MGAPLSGYVQKRCTCGGFDVLIDQLRVHGRGGLSVDKILQAIDFGIWQALIALWPLFFLLIRISHLHY